MPGEARNCRSTTRKVSILIADYNSLRSEAVTRTGHGLILLLLTSGWFTFREITKANRRLREIELDVNDRAGEDLLV
jgi:hypothetical protein